MKKRHIAAILVAVILMASVAQIAYARYTDISVISASLSFGSGTATPGGSLKAKVAENSVTVKVTLKKKNGSSWSTYAGPWSSSGLRIATKSQTVNIEPGIYKSVTTGYVYDPDGNLLETETIETAEKTYP